MRILYIVTAFPRGPGDVITPWLVETIRRLGDRGVEVEVLAPSYRGLGSHVVNGIRVHRFRYAPRALETLTHDQTVPDRLRERPAYAALLPGYLACGAAAAARLARSGRFDVVHAFWPLPHGLFGLAARRSGGVPVVSTFFGVELSWLRSQLVLLTPLVRTIIRRSDAVTVISSHTAAEVERVAPGVALRTIPFGAALPEGGSPAPRRAREPDAPFRVLFVGRLVERKGVSVLIRAVAAIPDRPRIRLEVVGDGPERAPLERLARELGIADRVEFAGFVPEDALAERYAAADLFVLPAVPDSKGDVEGLGVVLIEALERVVPVIASRSGGIPDIVIDGSTGLLVEPGDVDGLAAAISRLIEDPDLASGLAERGRAHVRSRFSWDRIVEDLERLYGELATRAPGGGVAA